MKEYIEEFYKLNIRNVKRERDDEKVSKYINGSRYEIQDQINMVTVRTMEDAYQIALKANEKLARKQTHRGIGRSPNRGKGITHNKVQNSKGEMEKPHSHSERGGSSLGRQPGGRNYFP